jgi:uncharacterized protein YeeX (DUF496 family)
MLIFSQSTKNNIMSELTFRNASREDVGLVLEFIKKLADYEKRLDEVIATEEELEKLAEDSRPRASRRRPMVGNWQSARQLQAAIANLLKEENVLAVVSGGGTFNVPTSRGVQYKVGEPEPTPEIILPIEDHGRMVRMVKKGNKVQMELDIKNTFTDNQKINNVIATLKELQAGGVIDNQNTTAIIGHLNNLLSSDMTAKRTNAQNIAANVGKKQ